MTKELVEKCLLTDAYNEWYRWFVGMLSRKTDDAEKNAIRHLVEAKISEAIPIIAEEIALWLKTWKFANRYDVIGDEIRDSIVNGIREDFGTHSGKDMEEVK